MLRGGRHLALPHGRREVGASWFCTLVTPTIERASSSCSTLALEIPTQRTLPASWSSFSAPIDSA